MDVSPLKRKIDFVKSFSTAAIASLIALCLTLPIIGFKLDETQGGLVLATRFEWVFRLSLAVFSTTLIISLISQITSTHARFRPIEDSNWKRLNWPLATGWVGIIFVGLFPFLPFADRYSIDLMTTILIYIMLGWGLNIVIGFAGLLDLGYVAFYAIGAYAYALSAELWGLSFWQALPLAALVSSCFAIVLGAPILRLRGDYLAIVTLGFGEIFRIVLTNWQTLTHGPNGISGIPRPSFFGIPFAREADTGIVPFHQVFGLDFSTEHRVIFLFYLVFLLALTVNFFALRLRKLPLGRAFEAMREDEIACQSLGLNPGAIKLSAYAIGAFIAGIAGAFFAARQGFISPESFTFSETALIVAIVVLAGAGSQLGVVIAAVILVGLPEVGREFADFRMLFFGAVMIVIMLIRPRGIFADRKPSIFLRPWA